MKIYTSEQIRKIDKYTIENEPISSVDLMERAADSIFTWIAQRYNLDDQFVIFAGPGNNGGDAWALARLLHKHEYKNINFYLLDITDKLSPDSEINRLRLEKETNISIHIIKTLQDLPNLTRDDFVIDGLFGSGLSRPLEGLSKQLVEHINKSAVKCVLSIDIPSGLFSEKNETSKSHSAIKADCTLMLQFPKLSCFFAENDVYYGKNVLLDIELNRRIIETTYSPYKYLENSDIKERIKPRPKFSHKGDYGHSLIIAGSYGMMGAAVLATKAAIRAGAGLVTAHLPRLGYEIMQNSVPEALVSIDKSDLMFTQIGNLEKYTSIAIGSGLNTNDDTVNAVHNLLSVVETPVVVDADAINILSQHKSWLSLLPRQSILTPHPKEFDRITQKHQTHYDRFVTQMELSQKHDIIIILKGHYSSISLPTGEVYFNSTGNPGMATGGVGDVLTGILTSLLAQGYSPKDAAIVGTYLHGLAGDIALQKESVQSLIASDIVNNIGSAFEEIKNEIYINNIN